VAGLEAAADTVGGAEDAVFAEVVAAEIAFWNMTGTPE
jgi:thiaminase/transcriptional activator TenA